MKWYENCILKKLFLTTTDWNVAWKRKSDSTYIVIENPLDYWLADSLLFETDNECYLFVEAFDKKSGIGKIGVFKNKDNVFTDFRVILEQPYHLSYPFVFKYGGSYYMIPETSNNNTLELYIATNFPHNWKKISVLLEGRYVDTTVIRQYDSYVEICSYDMNSCSFVSGILDMNKYKIHFDTIIRDVNYRLRAGGTPFSIGYDIWRPIQDNTFFYGQSLNKINCSTNSIEQFMQPCSIKTNDGITYRRLHTYSQTDNYEAIDLSDYTFDLFKVIRKLRVSK